jgi:hypothetical protein
VGGLPEDMELQLAEPLRLLFKDEVRRIGAELGVPKIILERHQIWDSCVFVSGTEPGIFKVEDTFLINVCV